MQKLYIGLFVILLAAIYRYDVFLFESPQSVHNWRQSDCASLVQNYHQQQLPPWEPRIHGIISEGGTSATNAPSEIPIYYWLAAQLYQLPGSGEAWYRALNTVIFLLGIAAFIHSMLVIGQNLWWAMLLGGLLFSSPVLVYYGNNFITNAPAFGLALLALHCFISFVISGKRSFWYKALLFFLLAGSLKITGLFLFLAIGGSIILNHLLGRKSLLKLGVFEYLLSALLLLTPILLWIWHANYLNFLNKTAYFSTGTFPIWSYTWPEIVEMSRQMYYNWRAEVFHPFTSFFFLLIAIYMWAVWRRVRPLFRMLLPVFMLGLSAFFLFQFYTFVDHDYYTINMYMIVALLLLAFTDHLRYFRPALLHSRPLHFMLLLLLCGNVIYARHQLQKRYAADKNQYYFQHQDVYGPAESWLDEIGVGLDDTIVYLPDDSHTALYLLNRYGWTSHRMLYPPDDTVFEFNRSEDQLRASVSRGAEFLIINGAENLYRLQYTSPFQRHLHARKGSLFVFDLQDTTRNFQRPERPVRWQWKSDFETADSLHGIGEALLSAGPSRGGRVLKMPADMNYALNLNLTDLSEGELIRVEVWIYSPDQAKAIPVIQSQEAGLAFVQERNIVSKSGDWQLFRQELFVDEALSRGGVKIFLWKPEGGISFFDQLQVQILSPNPLEN